MKKIILLLTIALGSFISHSQCELIVTDTTVFYEKACDSYTTPNGNVITSSGTYIEDYINIDGCVVENRTINVQIISGMAYALLLTVCDEYTSVNNNVYSMTGSYSELETGIQGCAADVNLTIDLTVNNSSSNTINASFCNEYIAANGDTFNTAGIHVITLQNNVGCDSLLTINLTSNNSTNSISASVCDMYIASSGDTFSTAGIHTFIVPNSVGCDSIVTLDLTINSTTSTINPIYTCQAYTAPDGQIYTVSGTYTAIIPNALACDSTITINLTVSMPSSATLTQSSCVSYTAPDGQIYTTSGSKTAIIPNMAGCDSTITINLTIKNPTTSTINISKCVTYTAPDGQVYTTSGVKTAVIPNSKGCDSTITINLTINPNPVVTTTLGIGNFSVTALPADMTYQWYDCNTGFAITSSTNQILEPVSGSYKVTVTDSNGCYSTSTCVAVSNTASLSENDLNSTISIFPNPSSDKITVSTTFTTKTELTILDINGKKVLTKTLNSMEHEIDVKSFDSGLYFIQLENESGKTVKQFVKN